MSLFNWQYNDEHGITQTYTPGQRRFIISFVIVGAAALIVLLRMMGAISWPAMIPSFN